MSKSACLCVSPGLPCSPWAAALLLAILVVSCVSGDPSCPEPRVEPVPALDGAIPFGSEVAGERARAFGPLSFGEEDEDERDKEMRRGVRRGTRDLDSHSSGPETIVLSCSPLRYAPKQSPPVRSRETRQHPEVRVRA